MLAIPRVDSDTSDAALVAKATIRAAERLGMTNKVLARVLGLSEASVSRMKKGEYSPEPGDKPFELAILFVRLYRSLDAVIGGDDAAAGEWLRNYNLALKGPPLELVESVSGLTNVIQYLDARRAVI